MSTLSSLRTLVLAGALAVCLAACSPEQEQGELYVRVLEGNVFDTTPVRGAFEPLRLRRSGFEYKCAECHTDLGLSKKRGFPEAEHKKILAEFDHGLNTQCLSCHNRADRNSYIDHDGTALPSDNPSRLCAKCHGPTYREWQVGIHGRQNGYWDKKQGARTKLVCVQCHDPHNPAFPLMKPDAPPIRSRLALEPEAH